MGGDSESASRKCGNQSSIKSKILESKKSLASELVRACVRSWGADLLVFYWHVQSPHHRSRFVVIMSVWEVNEALPRTSSLLLDGTTLPCFNILIFFKTWSFVFTSCAFLDQWLLYTRQNCRQVLDSFLIFFLTPHRTHTHSKNPLALRSLAL